MNRRDPLTLFGLGVMSLVMPVLGLPLAAYVLSASGDVLRDIDAGTVNDGGRELLGMSRLFASLAIAFSIVLMLLVFAGVRPDSYYIEQEQAASRLWSE